jgi:uncharacterized RDD family membrane protein YckC
MKYENCQRKRTDDLNSPDYSISTPENVDLHLELAGIGNRILAALIDSAISFLIIGCIAVFCILISLLIERTGIAGPQHSMIVMCIAGIAVLICFFIHFGYHIIFEGIWQGQTPGKKVAQIRVIETNGQPVSWAGVFIRNIVRALDVGLFLIGLLVMIINRNEKRLGDLAAGTLVIRERKSDLSVADIKLLTDAKEDLLLDVGRVSPQEYDLLARYLRRRSTLADSHRPLVATRLEQYFREKLGEEPEVGSNRTGGPDRFLEKVYLSYRARGAE